MKANLTSTKLSTILRAQEIAHELMMKSNEDNICHCILCGKEVDQKRFNNILSCISGSIEELCELYLECHNIDE